MGNRPTFEGAGFSVETHILNFEPVDLTEDTALRLEFLFRLRGEQKFPDTEALKAQIFKDVARAKRYFRSCRLLDEAALRKSWPSDLNLLFSMII